MVKIGIFASHPAHYQDSLFLGIINHKDVVGDIIFYDDIPSDHKEWNEQRPEYSNIHYINKKISLLKGEKLHINVSRFLKNKYDIVVIPGYMPFTSLVLLIKCMVRGIKYIYCADTLSLPKESKLKISCFKKHLCRLIESKATGLWIPGEAAGYFWTKLCGERVKKKLIYGRYILDKVCVSNLMDASQRDEFKNSLGIKDSDYVFFFCAALIPSKRVKNLLLAFEKISGSVDNVRCLIIGYGDEENIVRSYKKRIGEKLIYIEKVPFAELNKYYEVSDCYVNPGEEPYSVALVQAVYNNQWIISSRLVGAAYDYVVDGENGDIVVEDDITALSERMLDAAKQGKHSPKEVNQKIMDRMSVENVSESVVIFCLSKCNGKSIRKQ